MTSKSKASSGASADSSSTNRRTTAEIAPAAPPAPKSWWQWLLVYPTLLVAIAGSIPTALEFYRSAAARVPYGHSGDAKLQDDLWAKNMRCTEAPFDGLLNEYNVQVDATICKSGDVLVRFWGPHDKKAYRWIPVERFDPQVSSFGMMSAAVAQTPPRRQFEVVVCQWSPEPGWVIRRTRNTETNVCFNEQIRTTSGQVVDRVPIECDAPCSGSRP